MENTQNPKRLIRRRAVESRTGYKKSQLYDLVKAGRFPAPVPLGGRAIAWVEAEVDEWIDERIRARNAKRAGVAA
jgi:prophage regulatory protein